MRNQKVSFIQNYFREKVAKLAEHYFHKTLRKPRGIEFGRERGGPASVSDPVMNKQDCRKINYKNSTF